MHDDSIVTAFELEQWEKSARRLIQCTSCWGVGQKHEQYKDRWELCKVCEGMGKSAAEPHVIQLIAEIHRLQAVQSREE